MKLKLATATTITRPLEIVDGFVVHVRSKTRRQLEDLYEECSTPKLNAVTGRMDRDLDDRQWSQKAPDAYIAGWEGLTPSVIRRLGLPLEEEPPVDSDGQVPYDPDIARQLWRYAYADRFSQPVAAFARSLLEALELEKKIDSMRCGD